ncbi:MAG: Heavy-metal resistance [Vampirovibrio sp.]|jgi:Spy/CpxP family protein refolding chaperone|nr:Heavy-metal resistance [Vampirovibrio sp.]
MTPRNPRKAFAFLAVPAALLLMAQPGWAAPDLNGNAGLFGMDCAQMNPMRIAQAESGKPGHASNPAEREQRRQRMIKELGLNPEQAQKMKAIKEQGRGQGRALNQQLHAKRQALMQYLQSPGANEAQARSMNNDINNLQKQISELRLKSWFAMRKVMTPEQLQKLNRLKRPGGNNRPGSHAGPPDHDRDGDM